MIGFLILFLHVLASPFKTRARLEAEICGCTLADRLLFVWLYRPFPSVLDAVMIVQPETVIRWHRKGFRLYWHWKSSSRDGRLRSPSSPDPCGMPRDRHPAP